MIKQQYRLWIIGVVAVLLVAVLILTGRNPANAGQTLALEAPAFVAVTESAGTPPEVAAMLNSEAGISAYMQTSAAIDLNLVRGEFRTIETETADYIIGSVPVPDHPERFDVHVYVHTEGWILAYYMNHEPASKMVDVRAWTINSTKLETVISIIAGALGESVSSLKYYDFRYPNATHILMVAEDHYDGRYFYIEIPTEYGYSERSFAVYNNSYYSSNWHLYINDTAATRSWYGSDMTYGSISSSQLLPGQSHHISLDSSGDSYGVLVITYREQ